MEIFSSCSVYCKAAYVVGYYNCITCSLVSFLTGFLSFSSHATLLLESFLGAGVSTLFKMKYTMTEPVLQVLNRNRVSFHPPDVPVAVILCAFALP